MVLLKLKFSEKTPHKTFWKFNTSLLKDKQYLDEINELIDNIIDEINELIDNIIDEINELRDNIIVEYAVFPYARDAMNNIPKDEIQLLVSDEI